MDENLKRAEPDLFDELGLEITYGDVEVGKEYKIFGMITRLLDETPGGVIAEINYNIIAKMNIQDRDRIEILKERAFEAGIFVATVKAKEPVIVVDCRTIVFGRKQAYNA